MREAHIASREAIRPRGGDDVDAPTDVLSSFGHGLSDTTFEYSDLRVEPAEIRPDESVRVHVRLTNTRTRAGCEVVQLYLRDVCSSTSTPVKSLKRFTKRHLEPGETRTVAFELHPRDMELIDRDLISRVEPGEFAVSVAGLRRTFEVKSD